VLALVAFGVSVVLSVYVLLPKEGLIFALDAPETYEGLFRDSVKRTTPRFTD
jgi:hypothetical protein